MQFFYVLEKSAAAAAMIFSKTYCYRAAAATIFSKNYRDRAAAAMIFSKTCRDRAAMDISGNDGATFIQSCLETILSQ